MAAGPGAEVAELQGWWDLIAFGPIQIPRINGPYLPNDVIRSGEPAYIVTVLILNPFLVLNNQITVCELLSTLALPYEITYQTGNLTKWQPAPPPLTGEHEDLYLVPHQCFYVNVLEFIPDDKDEVMYEMNISARIFGAGKLLATAGRLRPRSGQLRPILLLAGPGPGRRAHSLPGLWRSARRAAARVTTDLTTRRRPGHAVVGPVSRC